VGGVVGHQRWSRYLQYDEARTHQTAGPRARACNATLCKPSGGGWSGVPALLRCGRPRRDGGGAPRACGPVAEAGLLRTQPRRAADADPDHDAQHEPASEDAQDDRHPAPPPGLRGSVPRPLSLTGDLRPEQCESWFLTLTTRGRRERRPGPSAPTSQPGRRVPEKVPVVPWGVQAKLPTVATRSDSSLGRRCRPAALGGTGVWTTRAATLGASTSAPGDGRTQDRRWGRRGGLR
jgi:hypothetical protein